MSAARAKNVSEINLEEFERRLRAASSPQSPVEDPLAELTRLVDTIAAERRAEEKVLDFAPARLPKAERFGLTPAPAPLAPPKARVEPVRPAPAPPVAPPEPEPEPVLDLAPEVEVEPEAELRPSLVEDEVSVDAPDSEYVDEAPDVAPEPRMAPQRARASSWYLKVGGLTALALLMGGGAVAFKVGMPSMHKSPPMILAAEGPSKVAPPSEAAVQSPNDSGALLTKDSATPAPVKIVSNEEQPVDLKASAAATAAQAPAEPSPVAPMADTPVIAPSDGGASAPVSPISATPKHVRTVSVRPDGTLISADSYAVAPVAPTAPTPAPSPTPTIRKSDASAPSALAATPTLDLPTKLSPPKSTARVVAPKTDTTVPSDSANTPIQLGPVAHAEKPAKPAKVKPAVVADAAPAESPVDTVAAASGGEWSVQLAAPRSESDAQSAISKLSRKYADALGGTSLGVHKADKNGEPIYRVRAAGMSKSEAGSLCAKIKDAGGDCFIAKN